MHFTEVIELLTQTGLGLMYLSYLNQAEEGFTHIGVGQTPACCCKQVCSGHDWLLLTRPGSLRLWIWADWWTIMHYCFDHVSVITDNNSYY